MAESAENPITPVTGSDAAEGGATTAAGAGLPVPAAVDGIIIDHIPAGGALRLLDYLGIDPTEEQVTLVMNTASGRYGTKDIVILENIFSVRGEVVALVAPKAAIDVVKNGVIVSKTEPEPARLLEGVGHCWNQECVTNCERDVAPRFYLVDEKKVLYRCAYCDSEARI
jgi:aspartate carbamoyltransferase regulatory subunit